MTDGGARPAPSLAPARGGLDADRRSRGAHRPDRGAHRPDRGAHRPDRDTDPPDRGNAARPTGLGPLVGAAAVRRRLRSSGLAFLTALSLSCSGRLPTYSELQRTYTLPPLPTAADHPETDAVVVLATTDTELYPTQEGLHTDQVVHRVVTLLRNVDERSTVEIDLFPGEELVEIEARVHEPDGRIRALRQAEIDPLRLVLGETEPPSEPAGPIVPAHPSLPVPPPVERNTVRFTFPDLVPGSTVEYRYRLRRGWPYLHDSWAVQELDPVLYAHYSLRVPRFLYDEEGVEWDWRYRFYRCARIGAPELTEQENPALGRTLTWTWTARDFPAFRPEPRMPAWSEYLAFARFAHSSWQSWDAVTGWYWRNHLEPALREPDPTVVAAAEAAAGPGTGERARVAAIVKTVQQLGDVELELGQGSLAPARPAVVLARGRGDAKDKAVLLVALLRAAGIEADPALVETADRGALDGRFPNWSFNHLLVLAIAEGEPLWIDPTVRHYPLGELPWRCEGVEAVLVRPDGTAELATTPRPGWEHNTRLFQARLTLGADGSCRGEADLVFDGEPGSLLAARLDPFEDRRAEIERIAEELVRGSYPDAIVDRVLLREPLPGRVLLSFLFRTERAIASPGGLPALAAAPFPFDDGLDLVAAETRRYPVELGYPSTWIRRWSVDLGPARYRLVAVPGPVEVANREMSFRSRYERKSETHLEAEQVLELRRSRIKTRNFEEAREVLRAREQAGPGAVVFVAG